MSFFEPEDDRPPRASSRRGAPARSAAEQQQLLVRRAVAGGLGLILLLVLVFGVRECRDARKERAFKDYSREVTTLVQQSEQQSEGIFGLLRNPGDRSAVDVQNEVNGLRQQADNLVSRAEGLDPREELAPANRFMVDALQFRRDGLAQIAAQLRTALGDEGRREAEARIAGGMQNFLVSDALYSQRVRPLLADQLREEEVLAEAPIAESRFLPDIDWLRTGTVASAIGRIRGGGRQDAGGGLRGTELGTVTVGGRTLTAGQPAEIPAGDGLAFTVQVTNGGEQDERGVTVSVTLEGGGGAPIEAERDIDSIATGATETVEIPLADAPPTGEPVTVTVRVVPVPGEEKTDNNEGKFSAVFAR